MSKRSLRISTKALFFTSAAFAGGSGYLLSLPAKPATVFSCYSEDIGARPYVQSVKGELRGLEAKFQVILQESYASGHVLNQENKWKLSPKTALSNESYVFDLKSEDSKKENPIKLEIQAISNSFGPRLWEGYLYMGKRMLPLSCTVESILK